MKKRKLSFFIISLCSLGLIVPLASCGGESSSSIESITTSESSTSSQQESSAEPCVHDNFKLEIIDPTIDVKGEVIVTCNDCNETQSMALEKLTDEESYMVLPDATEPDCTKDHVITYVLKKNNKLKAAIDKAFTMFDKTAVLNAIFKDGQAPQFTHTIVALKNHDVEIKEVKKPDYKNDGEYILECKTCHKSVNIKLPKVTVDYNNYAFTYSDNPEQVKVDVQLDAIKKELSKLTDYNLGDIDVVANKIKDKMGSLMLGEYIGDSHVVFAHTGLLEIYYKIPTDYYSQIYKTNIEWDNEETKDTYFEPRYINLSGCSEPVKKYLFLSDIAKNKIRRESTNPNITECPSVLRGMDISGMFLPITEEEVDAHVLEENKHVYEALNITLPTLDKEGKINLECKTCHYSKEIAIPNLRSSKAFNVHFDLHKAADVYTPKQTFIEDVYKEINKKFQCVKEEFIPLLTEKLTIEIEMKIKAVVSHKVTQVNEMIKFEFYVKENYLIDELKLTFDPHGATKDYYTSKLSQTNCNDLHRTYYLSDKGATAVANLSNKLDPSRIVNLLKNIEVGNLPPTRDELMNRDIVHVFSIVELVPNTTYGYEVNGRIVYQCSGCQKKFTIKFCYNDITKSDGGVEPKRVLYLEGLIELIGLKFPLLTPDEVAQMGRLVEPRGEELFNGPKNAGATLPQTNM